MVKSGTGQEIFAPKIDNKLQFKTILAGQGITLSGGSTLSITADRRCNTGYSYK